MEPYLQDTDFTLYVGDVREVLATLPDGSVDCVVTSPPYWGLRDYGTGSWDGGDADCDHKQTKPVEPPKRYTPGGDYIFDPGGRLFVDVCGKCGARRQDQQLGLEPTPDAYVENMVQVFREVRRVLADHGTCWVNLGDSYATNPGNGRGGGEKVEGGIPHYSAANKLGVGLKPKDLVGIPWRVAFALQADGWYLRADIIWAKPNPMPESVTDRPTKAHEYVFLLSKRPRYWFDAEAVREPHKPTIWSEKGALNGSVDSLRRPIEDGERGDSRAWTPGQRQYNPAGRNVRSVWEIATQPYPEAHFATYPEELVRRCLLAGCPLEVCRTCGNPRERIVEYGDKVPVRGKPIDLGGVPISDMKAGSARLVYNGDESMVRTDEGWSFLKRSIVGSSWSDCGHNSYRPGSVLDPFIGSGTTAVVARKHGRRTIGIELNPAYAELAARRTRQLSLLA